jgi:SM-20-related protein
MSNVELAQRIRVFDDMIPKELQTQLAALVKRPIWAYGWKSNSDKDKYSFWHTHFAGGDLNSRLNCLEQLRNTPSTQCVALLWDLLSKTILKGHEPLRAYGNAHTFGTEGYIHVDNRDTENYFSTIIYANDEWKAWWGGETLFYSLDQKDIIKAGAALPFRIVTFPGHIPHKANAPARDCPHLRTAIVFKSHKAPLVGTTVTEG